MPSAATLLDQGLTYRCGAYAVRAWFEGYGYVVAPTDAWAKYASLADSQKGLAFEQVHDFVTEVALELGTTVSWLGDGYLRDFPTFDQMAGANSRILKLCVPGHYRRPAAPNA